MTYVHRPLKSFLIGKLSREVKKGRLDGKAAIVTGGGSGMGRATSMLFA